MTVSSQGTNRPQNQDWVDARCDDVAGSAVIAVADGHGIHGLEGARTAVEAFLEHASAFVRRVPHESARQIRSDAYHRFGREVVHSWRNRVRAAYQTSSTPVDLFDYGSTLLGVAVSPDAIVAWQLGDGDIAFVSDDGSVLCPTKAATEPLVGDETWSICVDEAWNYLSAYWMPLTARHTVPALVLASTDGLSKSFAERSGFVEFAAGVRRELAIHGELLESRLSAWATAAAEHSGDDASLALAWRNGGPL